MKTTKMTRTRCECDYCGKKNWSQGYMRKHELHCTMNPERQCRVCKMVESEQVPIDKLLALLPDPSPYGRETPEGWCYVDESFTLVVNVALPALRDACGNCPACILAALRQRDVKVPMATDFNFTQEMKSVWDDINAEQRIRDEESYYG